MNIRLSDTYRLHPKRDVLLLEELTPPEEPSVKVLPNQHYQVSGVLERGELKRLFSRVGNIDHLEIKRQAIYGDDLAAPQSKNTKVLDLQYSRFTKDSMIAISKFKQLEILRLDGVRYYDINNLKFLEQLPSLLFLSLGDSELSDGQVNYVTGIKSLRFINIRDCPRLSQDALVKLATKDGLQGIGVSIIYCDRAFFQVIKDLHTVQLFGVSDYDVPIVKELNAIDLMQKLKELRVHSRQVSEESIEQFKLINPQCSVRSLIKYD